MHARIADIQSRIIALQTQHSTTATPAASTAAGGATFASYLSDAVTTRSAGTYKLNSNGIPTDLAAYGNGRIPATALEPVGTTGHKLWAPAAESLTRLIADAKRDGVTIGITDSYRSYDEQVAAFAGKPRLAAVPGTSNHGWGLAVDLCGGVDTAGTPQWTWMQANAGRFGFVNPPWARPGGEKPEPWHWEYGSLT